MTERSRATGGSPRLGITAGDPAGIGPEIVACALAAGSLTGLGRILVFAQPALFDAACREAGLDPLPRAGASRPGPTRAMLVPVEAGPVPPDFAPGRPGAFTGSVAAACVRAAAGEALAGRIDALVTAPVAKSALRAAGIPHPGHTEFLAELAGAASVAMMFVARGLRLALATIHVPLAEVSRRLDAESLVETLRLVRECLVGRVGIARPRIAMLGLNPHAGEGGLFGEEESRILEPALGAARSRGWDVDGPFPADAFFLRRRGDYDAVLAMYHDQGLIPVKLLSGGRAVNVTLGLPFIRTSVDHGTAFDIAGKGVASPDSLVEAARLAAAWSTVSPPP